MGASTKGVHRVARYLARNYTDVYVAVGKEFGLGIVGIMGEVEAANTWCDAWLLDTQAILALKHLRRFFK